MHDLTLDWIHHKFPKLNFLRRIGSYVTQESQYVKMQRPALASKVSLYLEFYTDNDVMA